MTYDLILKGGTVVSPGGMTQTDVGVIGERIAHIGNLTGVDAGEVYDATGLHILPGVIDSQVHFREPGLEYKADLETEARSAALGGVVAVFEMPNTNPSTTTPEALTDKLARAKGRMDTDHAFYAGATHENIVLLPEMEKMLGCCGVKVFMGASTGDLLIKDDEGVEAVLRAIKRRAAFHSEDEYRLEERRGLAVPGDWQSHIVVRDVEAAVSSTRRLLRLARKTGKRIHVLHISTAEEMELLRDAKDLASVEVLPNHLTLAAPDCYERLKGFAQQNPPVREQRHQEARHRQRNISHRATDAERGHAVAAHRPAKLRAIDEQHEPDHCHHQRGKAQQRARARSEFFLEQRDADVKALVDPRRGSEHHIPDHQDQRGLLGP